MMATMLLMIGRDRRGAASAVADDIPPDAANTLAGLAKKYRDLNAYADEGTITVSLAGPGVLLEQQGAKVPIAFVRPNQIACATCASRYGPW
jgi:hypothetical protein